MIDKYLKMGEVMKILGVGRDTLRSWDTNGVLTPSRLPGGHRRYKESDVLNFYDKQVSTKSDDRMVIAYCRVSSSDQSNDLITQVTNVESYCYSKGYTFRTITDLGSGLNYNKSGLIELLDLVMNDQVSKLVINYKDRLVRYGFELIEQVCAKHNVVIEIINHSDNKSFEEELVEDVLSIITVFSAKLYGSRSKKSKQLIAENKKILNQ